jgi:multidrug resistance efflux pump
MLEFMLCSMLTILPDFLIRRYVQDKRWGREITFVTLWYELRWGITACVLLTLSLITLVFYYHPSTTHAAPFFRTVTILPEQGGRVDEVFVENGQVVESGTPLFNLYEDTQYSAVTTARSRIGQIVAETEVAKSELASAVGLVHQAEGSLAQAENELRMKRELSAKGRDLVSEQEVQRLENAVDAKQGSLESAVANRETVEATISTVLPAEKLIAQDSLQQAQVELDKTIVYAGVTGRLMQFMLQPGDYVSPVMRPAGILVPTGGDLASGRSVIQAGFNQLAAPVIHIGTLAEVICLSKPFTVIPMVVSHVFEVIPSGQLRPSDTLIDAQDRARPGTLGVLMQPLYPNGMDGVIPGTKCIANAYSNHHALLASGQVSGMEAVFLHVVDTVGLVHAIILRIQALMLPVKSLVFGGH